ncbi:hypothetical protein [Myroides injenensis]|uniref:hypothetical protein n=1 Tax=Myroides injenensis TaxID=1183151 RepID=UPI000288827D|nr:hypothetical protein [Myroides injenensis]
MAISIKENHLIANTEISFKLGSESIILPNINKSRYGNDIPEVLYNKKNNSYLVQPYFDKKFPQEIIPRNKEDIAFLQKVSYINAIPNYPYFIAGVFDYDKWQYQWKYIDLSGRLYDSIEANDFFTLDILSNVLRPYKSEIIPADKVPNTYQIDKIRKVYQSDNIFIAFLINDQQEKTVGLWDNHYKNWKITPTYNDITILDIERGIIAISLKNNEYQLYSLKTNSLISPTLYNYINSDGWTNITKDNTRIYFYTDISTGEEYRDLD